ncbi:hypothetical protein P152DRAFT_512671 [Eremomyces bilateralis CBS 781.70]|uniref:Uncharacterized protein n=1 Tax=Eremomyces bilateralis CBS 781.70 TaxID=1392243 RepID=A0A6G1G8B8_9PEZI|nr:uncharacterized protein P152DRAFT_512671 [Eremomyces bilateralis CBS 781.70]KAF1814273.1 hypothetical protein P152DRAFT_512671 [Eremomyces bilateralis CBS 781.70]
MRNICLLLAAILNTGSAARLTTLFPFESPLSHDDALPEPFNFTLADLNDSVHELLRRQSNACPRGYNNCNHLGAPGLCCQSNSNCARDPNGNLACCPIGAACTGVVSSTVLGDSPSSSSVNGGGVIIGGTSSASFGAPAATTAAGTGSMVPNQYYPYPYISTTYVNAAACSSAWSTCQGHSTSCAGALGGGVNGITVSAPNGGVTVPGATATFQPAEASAICSSLSAQACYGLQVAACEAFGTGLNSFVAGGDAAPRPTGCDLAYRMGAGLAMGVAGQLLAA